MILLGNLNPAPDGSIMHIIDMMQSFRSTYLAVWYSETGNYTIVHQNTIQ